jgi:hypothetical protein
LYFFDEKKYCDEELDGFVEDGFELLPKSDGMGLPFSK